MTGLPRFQLNAVAIYIYQDSIDLFLIRPAPTRLERDGDVVGPSVVAARRGGIERRQHLLARQITGEPDPVMPHPE